VVSVTLDSWSEDDIAIMEAVGGNAAANSVYEACLPPDVQKPTADASVEERSDWIM
jgi:stromal membrane-associated protein